MAHNLVDVDTWTAAVTVPDDGDAANAASVEAGMQDLADRTYYLHEKIVGVASTITVPIPLCASAFNQDARFIASDGIAAYGYGCWEQADPTSGGGLAFGIYLPFESGQLSSVTLYVTGRWSGAAHAGPVGTMPTLTIQQQALATGVVTDLATVTDTTVAPATYDVPHTIVNPCGPVPIGPTHTYWLVVTGEAGANSATHHFAVYGATATIIP
jgi:hypothetical protein